MRWLSIFLILSITLFFACSKKSSSAKDDGAITPVELLEYANGIYDKGDYESAFLAYGLIYKDYPTSREYIDAAIGLSRCYGQLDNYEKEFELIHNLLRENLIPSKVPQVYNAIAEFYENSAGISEELTGEGTQDLETAMGYYKKAIEYPNSEDKRAKGFAQYRIGELFEGFQNYDKAISAYQKTTQDYPEETWALLATEKIGIIEARIERQNYYNDIPQSKDSEESSVSENVSQPTQSETVEQPQKSQEEPAKPKEKSSPEENENIAPPDTSLSEKPELD